MRTNLETLELSTDGRIDERARRLAIARDALASVDRPRGFRVKLRVKYWKPGALVSHMARAIADAIVKRQGVHTLDLRRAGFTQAQIDAHFADALTLARQLDGAVNTIEAAA